MEKNLTDIFAGTIYELANSEFPEEVVREARLCLLDFLGPILGGSAMLKPQLTEYLDLQPAVSDGVTLVGMGGRKASLQNAAMVNGMFGHVLELDDGHRFSTVHLAATTMPALMAACEWYDLTMDDLIRGIIIGYETGVRLGRALQPSHRARGFQSSGTLGTVAATMAVAAALKFDLEHMTAALAAATSSAGGNNEMIKNVSTMKAYNVGRAGQDGISAALIAKVGFRGPYDPMNGTFGWMNAMAEKWDGSGLDIANDPGWNIMGAYHKPYASCRHTHAAVEGAFMIRKEHNIQHEDVADIKVRMYGQGVAGHEDVVVPSILAGKQSTPFCIALALRDGSVGISAFKEETLTDPEIRRLSACTHLHADEEMTKMVPRKRSAEVTITLKDGTSHTAMADHPKGEPEFPMTLDDYIVKFHELAAMGGKSQEERDDIIQMAMNFNGSVRELMAKLQ